MSTIRPVFYVSDGTGITAETIGHSLLTQFSGFSFITDRMSFVDDPEKAREACARIQAAGERYQVRPIVVNSCVDQSLSLILADSGALINTEVLRLEAVTRPDLLSRFGTDQFITLDRRRRSNDGTVVSLERALMPATGGLESLPRVGLIDNSLTITLAAYGYIGERGDQWIGAEPLNAEDAELLGRPVGTVFLKALRTTYDRQNRFMEQVESLLDPVHFRLHLQFGESK